MIHIPVLLHEVLEVLDLKPGQFVIDGTLGSGGHARELIKGIALRSSPSEASAKEGVFLGIDRDAQAISSFQAEQPGVQVHTRQANYSELPHILAELHLPKADALLLDLGFSSDQLSKGSFAGSPAFGGRGFSFQADEPLLMTYDDAGTPVRELLRELDEQKLTEILTELGEERYAKKIAASIKQAKVMETTQDLVRAVAAAVPKGYEHGRINPATRTFQALRIYANGELEHLKLLLEHIDEVVKEGGRVAVISFHSLEDRIVKNFFRDYARGQRRSADSGELPNTGVHAPTLITKKPITAAAEEIAANPRSRSAKLRALQI